MMMHALSVEPIEIEIEPAEIDLKLIDTEPAELEPDDRAS